MEGFGTAVISQIDGVPFVVSADETIGITPELLANVDPVHLPVGKDGTITLAGDPQYRYRPVRFAAFHVIVCERVP